MRFKYCSHSAFLLGWFCWLTEKEVVCIQWSSRALQWVFFLGLVTLWAGWWSRHEWIGPIVENIAWSVGQDGKRLQHRNERGFEVTARAFAWVIQSNGNGMNCSCFWFFCGGFWSCFSSKFMRHCQPIHPLNHLGLGNQGTSYSSQEAVLFSGRHKSKALFSVPCVLLEKNIITNRILLNNLFVRFFPLSITKLFQTLLSIEQTWGTMTSRKNYDHWQWATS